MMILFEAIVVDNSKVSLTEVQSVGWVRLLDETFSMSRLLDSLGSDFTLRLLSQEVFSAVESVVLLFVLFFGGMEMRVVHVFLSAESLQVSVVLELVNLILSETSVENIEVSEHVFLGLEVSGVDVKVGEPVVGTESFVVAVVGSGSSSSNGGGDEHAWDSSLVIKNVWVSIKINYRTPKFAFNISLKLQLFLKNDRKFFIHSLTGYFIVVHSKFQFLKKTHLSLSLLKLLMLA